MEHQRLRAAAYRAVMRQHMHIIGPWRRKSLLAQRALTWSLQPQRLCCSRCRLLAHVGSSRLACGDRMELLRPRAARPRGDGQRRVARSRIARGHARHCARIDPRHRERTSGRHFVHAGRDGRTRRRDTLAGDAAPAHATLRCCQPPHPRARRDRLRADGTRPAPGLRARPARLGLHGTRHHRLAAGLRRWPARPAPQRSDGLWRTLRHGDGCTARTRAVHRRGEGRHRRRVGTDRRALALPLRRAAAVVPAPFARSCHRASGGASSARASASR